MDLTGERAGVSWVHDGTAVPRMEPGAFGGQENHGTVSEEYAEAVLTLAEPSGATRVEQWLDAHGFRFVPLRIGLLVQGDRKTFDAAFGVDLRREPLPATLPVPADLRGLVASITIPSLRRYH